MTVPENTAQALNKAMLEAVEFVHAEGWDASPTLFALVPTRLLADQLADPDDAAPLTLVVQELPPHILPGSDELGDYLSRLAWPAQIEGVVLAQEIMFRDSGDPALADAPARPARLFSGVLRRVSSSRSCSCAPRRRSSRRAGPSPRTTSNCGAARTSPRVSSRPCVSVSSRTPIWSTRLGGNVVPQGACALVRTFRPARLARTTPSPRRCCSASG